MTHPTDLQLKRGLALRPRFNARSCPLCREPVSTHRETCPDCQVAYHPSCLLELSSGSCVTLGCTRRDPPLSSLHVRMARAREGAERRAPPGVRHLVVLTQLLWGVFCFGLSVFLVVAALGGIQTHSDLWYVSLFLPAVAFFSLGERATRPR